MKKFYLLLIAIFTLNIANAQWQHTSFDSTKTAAALAINGDSIFAGTNNGAVFLSINNGGSWTALNTGIPIGNYSVFSIVINGSNIIVGTTGGIYLSTNNGGTWSEVFNYTQVTGGVKALTISGNTLFAGSYGGGVYFSSNNGNSWSTWSGFSANTDILSLVINSNNVFAGTTSGVYTSSIFGGSWSAVNTGIQTGTSGINALAISGNNIFAGTTSGMYISSNNGTSWTSVNTGLTNTNVQTLAISGNNIFAGTIDGVFLSSNNGSSWDILGTGLGNGIYTYVVSLAINNSNIYAGTGNGLWKLSLLDTITTFANPTIGGTTSGGGTFTLNQYCTVKATALTGYTFTNWTENGNIVSADTSYTFNVTANRNLVANFTQIATQYTITTSANPTNGGTASGGGTFTLNQPCTVKATPLTGYSFVDWTENGNIVSIDTSYFFTVTANRNLVANFMLITTQYTITTSANPTIGGTTSGGGTFSINQSCTIKATALTGYTFANWTENSNIVSTDTSYTFYVTANRNLVANFAQNATQYTITTSTNPTNGGTASGGGTFTLNQSCTVKATTLTGYTFVDWTENSNILSVDTSYTFTVTANRNLVANFFLIPGIDSYSFNKSVNNYPNPVINELTIETNSNIKQEFEIVNIIGQTVYISSINKKATVNTSAFPSGVYILKLYTDKEIIVKKFIKQ